MKVIEEYIDNLDDELLFEGDDTLSLFSRIRKIKLSSKDKEEGKTKLKDIESTDRYKNIKASIINFSINPTRQNSIKLNDEIKKEVGNYAVSQIGTAFAVIISLGFALPRKLKGKPFGADVISSLICVLAELPPVVISRLFSKSGKNLVQIKDDIAANNVVSKFSMIEMIIGFLLIIPWLVPAAAGAMIYGSVALISVTLTKMIFSLYIGIKTNRFDQAIEISKKKVSQIAEMFYPKKGVVKTSF